MFPSKFARIKNIFWPIEKHENKKFLPMAFMMFCILFNYSMLRSIKDGFVIPQIGPEAVSFLKTYVVLPSSVLAILIYSKLCNIMNQRQVFYSIVLFFVLYLTFFTFVLYPYPESVRIGDETTEALIQAAPYLQWFIKIIQKWDFATFYTFAELWGSMIMSLLFWQFANDIVKTEEAKRFYSMFGLIGNLGLVLCGYVLSNFLGNNPIIVTKLKFTPVFVTTIISGVLIILTYYWINSNVISDSQLGISSDIKKPGKKKPKLSLAESFKLIFSSKYLGLIAILVIAYGTSVNLVEGVWKAKIRALYPDSEQYTIFMGNFQRYQGWVAILFMLIGSNILRTVSWRVAAMLTPLMMLITGLGFFGFIFYGDIMSGYLDLATNPLVLAVALGTIQNVLSKATKYSLFDSTKEMAYIPLDPEFKTKGKAAVDVIGGRLGKSSGGFIQSTFFIFGFNFDTATPYFSLVFFVIVLIWLYAVNNLSYEYNKELEKVKEA